LDRWTEALVDLVETAADAGRRDLAIFRCLHRRGGPPRRTTEDSAIASDRAADDGLPVFHDDQGLGPAGPNLPQGGPEQSVEGGQRWSRPFALEHSHLLSEGEDFKAASPRL